MKTNLDVLKEWNPSLKNQENLKTFLQIYESFSFILPERVTQYAEIVKDIHEMHEIGDANITIQIRDGEIINTECGKRKKFR